MKLSKSKVKNFYHVLIEYDAIGYFNIKTGCDHDNC